MPRGEEPPTIEWIPGKGKGLLLLTCFSLHPLDLTFLHEGSKTLVDGLVNIEKLVGGTANPSPSPSPGTPPKDSSLSPWCPACLTDSRLSSWWHRCGNPPTGGVAKLTGSSEGGATPPPPHLAPCDTYFFGASGPSRIGDWREQNQQKWSSEEGDRYGGWGEHLYLTFSGLIPCHPPAFSG